MASPSELGGFDEFRDVLATWASSSAIRARACSNSARNCTISAACSTTSATSSSYDGTDGAGGSPDTPEPYGPINHAAPTLRDYQITEQPQHAARAKTNDLRDLTSYGTAAAGLDAARSVAQITRD
ncbi:hypothetical protein [Frankia sp. AgKG'84/4]|uniref:hypothetical protein n=1 Tax=Frankia sp. AgKG'84/4 TaxID=573490 RepID=UPI002029F4D5|nr:hypothetical protein [Frankia sp. AgKG'84/4]MCL9794997.1 hypothetical protein [Frankia sp. AgKG'84/4]